MNNLRLSACLPAFAADQHLTSLSSLLDRMDDQTAPALDAPTARTWSFENRLVQVRLGIASSLFAALRARDAPTAAHCLRVSVGASAWASELEISAEQRDQIEVAALLHDIGKIGVPDFVLKKPAALSPEEQHLMLQHRRMGLDILRHAVASPEMLNILKYSNVWYDGSRPGSDRRGQDIPVGARLITIVDAFDAMTTDQIYRAAFSRERAVAELYRHSGTQFSPELVENFCQMVMSDSVDLNAAVSQRWLRQLLPEGSDQLWQLQTFEPAADGFGHELFHEKLLHNMLDGVVFIDVAGLILRWNRAMQRLTGLATSAVAQKYWEPALIGLQDEQGKPLESRECPLLEVLRSRTQSLRRMSIRGPEGESRQVDAHFAPIIAADGTVHGAALVMHDATSRASLEQRVQTLHERATRDPLTKVANRAEFDRQHEQFVASHRDRKRPGSLIICDIDYFKRVNDQYGHQAGDEALISFAALISRYCRPGDLAARYGGEEFLLLCADCDVATAVTRADELRIELSETPLPMLEDKCLTASFGVTELQAGDTPETMLSRADRALLQAKETGRNRVVHLGSPEAAEKADSGRGWFSWFEAARSDQVAEQALVTRVPFDVALEKLRGFIADQRAELVSVSEDLLVMRIDGSNPAPLRRKSDRALPFEIDVTFLDDPEPVAQGTSRTLLNVSIRPLRGRDRRKGDVTERAQQLLVSLKSYLMATEYKLPRKADRDRAPIV